MSTHGNPAPKKGSGLVKTMKITIGLVGVVVVGLTILRFASASTFGVVADATGGWHRSLTLYFWKDVSGEFITQAKLPAAEAKRARATLAALATSIGERKGDDKQQEALEKAAHGFITQFESGKRSADDVRPLLEKAQGALDALAGKKKPAKKTEPPEGAEKPADGEKQPVEGEKQPVEGEKPEGDDGDKPADDGKADGDAGDGEKSGG